MNISPGSYTNERPNIVVFLVDDMGWQDTSVPFWKETTPFNDRYRTPNMEHLAEAGMKFTQAYACPVCSPSRVSLLTGLNAARHRVTNWTLRKNITQDVQSAVQLSGGPHLSARSRRSRPQRPSLKSAAESRPTCAPSWSFPHHWAPARRAPLLTPQPVRDRTQR